MSVFLETKELETWMDVLLQCKALDEVQIKRLCEKVVDGPLIELNLCIHLGS